MLLKLWIELREVVVEMCVSDVEVVLMELYFLQLAHKLLAVFHCFMALLSLTLVCLVPAANLLKN